MFEGREERKRDLRFWLVSIVSAVFFTALLFAADDVGGRLLARGVFIGAVLVWALLQWRRRRR